MKILYPVLCGILLCSYMMNGPGNAVAGDKDKVNIRPYCYPKNDLKEPKVYVMVNDNTGAKEYFKFQLTDRANYYLITNTTYDSTFKVTSVEKDSLDPKYVTVNVVEMNTDLDISESHFSWMMPLTNTVSLVDHGTMRVEGTQVVIDLFHHFSRALPPAKQHYYHGQDCIKDSIEMIVNVPHEKGITSIPIGNMVTYYAKDLGAICCVMNINNSIETHYIDKIISVEDFDKMAATYK